LDFTYIIKIMKIKCLINFLKNQFKSNNNYIYKLVELLKEIANYRKKSKNLKI